jgi:SAM-dependent methyltransferase
VEPKAIFRAAKKRVRSFVTRVRYFGRRRFCPICRRHASAFQARGVVTRTEARCPYCGSLERHRLVWLFFERCTDLWTAPRKKMLHIAPEQCFSDALRKARYVDWLSADLGSPRAMIRMDITDIQYDDGFFDVIYCSHVLEHVADDRAAMREFARVLKPSGWAVLLVPITVERTYEDPSIVDPKERELAFGQWDHVRRYGGDFAERLEESGFLVTPFSSSQIASSAEIDTMRLVDSETLYFCRKK